MLYPTTTTKSRVTDMVKTIAANEAEKKFKQLLDEVNKGSSQYIFEKDNQKLGVLLSFKDFNDFQQLLKSKTQAKERFFEIVDQIRERNKNIPYEQIEKDVAQAVSEVRQMKYKSE